MNTKSIFIVMGVIIILILIGLIFIFIKNPSQPIQNEIIFKQDGVIIKDNPGFKPGVWYLVYEAPGKPSLTKELDVGNIQVTNLQKGMRIHIEGVESNGIVKVSRLEILTQYQTVKLYYYNPDNDKDASGNIQCSAQGLVAVDRQIPISQTPIQDVVKLLLKGQLTSQEKAQGITTEFPLDGVQLQGANLKNGILTLEFSDLQNKTGGGSCRVNILWKQIEATAKQFAGVEQVKFIPDYLFQP